MQVTSEVYIGLQVTSEVEAWVILWNGAITPLIKIGGGKIYLSVGVVVCCAPDLIFHYVIIINSFGFIYR